MTTCDLGISNNVLAILKAIGKKSIKQHSLIGLGRSLKLQNTNGSVWLYPNAGQFTVYASDPLEGNVLKQYV